MARRSTRTTLENEIERARFEGRWDTVRKLVEQISTRTTSESKPGKFTLNYLAIILCYSSFHLQYLIVETILIICVCFVNYSGFKLESLIIFIYIKLVYVLLKHLCLSIIVHFPYISILDCLTCNQCINQEKGEISWKLWSYISLYNLQYNKETSALKMSLLFGWVLFGYKSFFI